MSRTLERADGSVTIEEVAGGERLLTVDPIEPEGAPPRQRWQTRYPDPLIERVLDVKGATWLCDEIQRDEDPAYVRHFLEQTILSYVPPDALRGKRLLDLGSGCGSSSLNLVRMFPGAHVIGVELVEEYVELARARADHYGMEEVAFVVSTDGGGLPDEIGTFDAVILSAVYEHMLPAERESLMAAIWSSLRPGGVLFINQLPHRYSPLETHTTGLPLINYLPDRLACLVARRLSKRVSDTDEWGDLLRRGIRGGTATEILRQLGPPGDAILLEPSRMGISDRIDLWFALSSGRWPTLKTLTRAVLKGLRAITGVTFVPELALAIQKGQPGLAGPGRTTGGGRSTSSPAAPAGHPPRRMTKRALAEGLVGARPMSSLVKLPLWRGVLVLAYHRILDDREEAPFDGGVYSATPSMLDAQLQFLTRNFEVVSPEALAGARNAWGRRVVVTFDDGYRDNYELAFPILRKHGAPATFFLTTGFVDNPSVAWWDELAWMVKQSPRRALDRGDWLECSLALDGDRRRAIAELTRTYKSLPSDRTEAFLDYCAEAAGTGRCDPRAGADLWMTWEMAAKLRDAGMTIGGHSVTHPVLGRAEPELQKREIEECALRLREELGLPMRFFAYPVGLRGSFDDATRRILRGAGVELAFSLYGGYVRPGQLDPYDVPRTTVGLSVGPRAFRALLGFPGFLARW
jgi:peptidoglycan/xylan/chitin deacetylase (PgdA/CDA1 family)/ubiquinone/menaquinone biosynthesis C-methylase UbiE